MRKCSKCKKRKPRNKTSSYCKYCHNEYQKEYYKKNPSSIRKSCIKRRNDIRKLVIDGKNKPCEDCNKKYPYYVMDYDHRSSKKKKFNLSIAASKYRSIKSIMLEIAKCDVVCSNCHRERTFNKMKK